jgi:hypothetical protein
MKREMGVDAQPSPLHEAVREPRQRNCRRPASTRRSEGCWRLHRLNDADNPLYQKWSGETYRSIVGVLAALPAGRENLYLPRGHFPDPSTVSKAMDRLMMAYFGRYSSRQRPYMIWNQWRLSMGLDSIGAPPVVGMRPRPTTESSR